MAGPAYFDAFRRIVVQPDNITISADAVDDTLTLVAGAGISLVANSNSDQITIVNTNSSQFSLGVAGDDSTLRTINSGETIRFAGTGGVTVTSNTEGAITINGPNLAAVSQNIIPTADVTYDIGSSTNRFRDIYLSSSTIYLGSTTVGVDSSGLLVVSEEYTGGEGIGGISSVEWTTASEIEIRTEDDSPYIEKLEALKIGDTFTFLTGSAGTFPPNTIVTVSGAITKTIAGGGFLDFVIPILQAPASNVFVYNFTLTRTPITELSQLSGEDLTLKRLVVDGIIIDTNVIRGTDSNADLELDASGTGAVSVIGDLKVSGNLATTSSKIAIGAGSAITSQGVLAIAVGTNAGNNSQGSYGIAIGNGAGETSQGSYSIAVGNSSGNTGQGLGSIAVGASSGLNDQGTYAVALGALAANNYQGPYGVAIGYQAGNAYQGTNAVAIGRQAGQTSQPANSIVINASGTQLDGTAAGLFVDPIRNISGVNFLTYNTSTKEITYTNTIGSININTNVIQTVDSNANLELAANGSGIVKALDYFEMSDGTSPQGEWTNFTPTWTASSSNPAIGNGLIEGRYKQVGKTVHVWMMMTASSTTTFGTGEYQVSLPVAARMIASVVLDLVMYDNGTRHYNSLAHNDYTTGGSLNNTSVTLFWDTGVVTNTAPFTWTDGDWFIISGTYEAS